jgi:hypothetical protein
MWAGALNAMGKEVCCYGQRLGACDPLVVVVAICYNI